MDTFTSNVDTSHPGASLFDVRSRRVVHQKRILFHQMRILLHQMRIHSMSAILFKFLVHQKRILFWRFAIKKSRSVHQKRILCTSKEDTTYIKRGYFFIKRGYRVHQKRILLQGFSKRLFQESLKREPRTYARAASLRASGTVLRPCCCVRRPQLQVAMQEGYGFGFSAPTLVERGSSRFHRPTVQEVKSLRTMAVSHSPPWCNARHPYKHQIEHF